MKKEALIIFVSFIVGIIFISGCAFDYEEEELLEEPVEEQITDLEVDELTDENVPEEIIEEDIQEEQPDEDDPTSLRFKPMWGDCEDKDDVRFTFSPIDPEAITLIEPMGKMHSSHTFPTKHMYISDVKGWQPDPIPIINDIVAPADGLIVDIGAASSVNEYTIIIWHSCSLMSFYIGVVGLSAEIRAITGELPPGSQWEALNGNAIFVKAGQRIGKNQGSLDFGVLDSKVSLTGWVIPEHQGGGVQIHTADPFDYFVEPVRSQMLEKNPRKVEPFGGKIDYDIDGRLVGNWFEKGTEGYESGSDTPDFSKGHLAIAYDFINPTLVQISFGAEDEIGITAEDCLLCESAYGVKGNKPDPADVSVDSGLVKYELVGREFIEGKFPEKKNVESNLLGVFLVQMLDDRTFKGEVFPKKTASQVSGFTSNAKIYERKVKSEIIFDCIINDWNYFY